MLCAICDCTSWYVIWGYAGVHADFKCVKLLHYLNSIKINCKRNKFRCIILHCILLTILMDICSLVLLMSCYWCAVARSTRLECECVWVNAYCFFSLHIFCSEFVIHDSWQHILSYNFPTHPTGCWPVHQQCAQSESTFAQIWFLFIFLYDVDLSTSLFFFIWRSLSDLIGIFKEYELRNN